MSEGDAVSFRRPPSTSSSEVDEWSDQQDVRFLKAVMLDLQSLNADVRNVQIDAEREELEGIWRFLATTTYMIQDAEDVLGNHGTPLNPQLEVEIEKKMMGSIKEARALVRSKSKPEKEDDHGADTLKLQDIRFRALQALRLLPGIVDFTNEQLLEEVAKGEEAHLETLATLQRFLIPSKPQEVQAIKRDVLFLKTAIWDFHFLHAGIKALGDGPEREEFEGLWRHFATTMAMMRDAADVLATRGTPLSPDLKVQVEKEIEGLVQIAKILLEEKLEAVDEVEGALVQHEEDKARFVDMKHRVVQALRHFSVRADFNDDKLAEEVISQEKKYLEIKRVPTTHNAYQPREIMSPEEERRTQTRLRWDEVWVTKTRITRVGPSLYSSRVPSCASPAVPQRRVLSANWLEEPQSESNATSEVVVTTMPLSFSSKPPTSSVPRRIEGKKGKGSWWSTLFR